MPVDDDPWWMDELPVDEPQELLRTYPELRQSIEPERLDELGLRSILDHPRALSKAWRAASVISAA